METLKTETNSQEEVDYSIAGAEIRAIHKALEAAKGQRKKASDLLGIDRKTLHRKIGKYNISYVSQEK